MDTRPKRQGEKDPEEEGSAAKEPQPPQPNADQDPEEEGSSGRPQR